MVISTVIFDFGGTLIKPSGVFPEEAARYLLSRSDGEHRAEVKELLDFDDRVFRDMLERREPGGLDFQLTQYLNLLQACLGLRFRGDLDEIAFECWLRQYQPQLQDGAADCLCKLKSNGVKLGLLSNTVLSGKSVGLALASFGILEVFDTVLCSSDVAYRKPHGLIFRAMLNLLNATLQESAMVGDTLEDDIGGAASYGMITVWYNPDGSPVSSFQPDHIVSNLRSVPEVLGFP
jgi:HAD superfamily hydrolase (TIGR01509 family)